MSLSGPLRHPLGPRHVSCGSGCDGLFTAGWSSETGSSAWSLWLAPGAEESSVVVSLAGVGSRLSKPTFWSGRLLQELFASSSGSFSLGQLGSG